MKQLKPDNQSDKLYKCQKNVHKSPNTMENTKRIKCRNILLIKKIYLYNLSFLSDFQVVRSFPEWIIQTLISCIFIISSIIVGARNLKNKPFRTEIIYKYIIMYKDIQGDLQKVYEFI